jgi:hypothetical protein
MFKLLLMALPLCLSVTAMADCTDITVPTELDGLIELDEAPTDGVSHFWYYPMHNLDFSDDNITVAFERLEGPTDWTYQFCGIDGEDEFCRPIQSWETGFEITILFPSEAEFDFDAQFVARSFGTGVVDVTITRELCPDDVINHILSLEVSETSAVGDLPETFALRQNYPNPFNPDTHIPFHLEAASNVRVEVYDLSGALVKTPMAGSHLIAGDHDLLFSAAGLPSGTYLYRITTDFGQAEGKMSLIK